MSQKPPSARAMEAARAIGDRFEDTEDDLVEIACIIDRAMAEPAAPPALREALPVRAIAKDAAENIYNDESVIETRSIDNEDTLDRWIRIITYAINAGLAQLEDAAPPAADRYEGLVATTMARPIGRLFIDSLIQGSIEEVMHRQDFGSSDFWLHKATLVVPHDPNCGCKAEDAAPPRGERLGTCEIKRPHLKSDTCIGEWVPLPPAPAKETP